MANNYTSTKLSFDTAYNFLESVADSSLNHIKYVFLGNSNVYANEALPDDITDTSANEKTVWDKMYAAKRVTGNDLKIVVPRYNWSANTKYIQYDDTLTLDTMKTANTGVQPFYIITTGYNVYKCLSNNASANSTIEPTGDYNSSNGYIQTTDGYWWKYMFNVKPSNKFLTDEWIPAPVRTSELAYGTSDANIIDGVLSTIVVTNSGSGYKNTTLTVNPFVTSQTILLISDTSNVAANMTIAGTGIIPRTYITAVDNVTNQITLSLPTSGAGGNTSNTVTVSTRVYVDGDGNNDTVATANLTSQAISKITVDSVGTGYSYANVYIYGTGTGATARAIVPPKFGHGFNPAKELSANAIMISTIFGALDSSEGGILSIDTSFRQVGLLANAHKYGNTKNYVTDTQANSVISQTTNVTLIAGVDYYLNEFVYQGNINSPTFSGFVHAQDVTGVRLIKVKGNISVGGLLKGEDSATSRAVDSVANPEFEPYSGDIIYVQNSLKTERADGQAENIKFVVKF
jgi:hypothetical protein